MNKNFYFHTKNCSNLEPIGKHETVDLESAVEFFAEQKHLSIDDFLLIYDVKEYEHTTKSDSRN